MISLQVTGEKATAKMLNTMAERCSKQRPLFAAAGRYLVQEEFPRMFREGGPQGRKWDRVLRGGRPLLNTGKLLGSIKSRVLDRDLELFTRHPGAAVQNFGATITAKSGLLRFRIGGRWVSKKKVVIKQREFMVITARARSNIAGLWAGIITKGFA